MTILWTILPGVLAPRPLYVDVRSIARGLHWDLRKPRENKWQTSHVPSCWTHFISTRTYEKQDKLFRTPKNLISKNIYICIYIYVCITVYNNRANGIDMNIQDHLGTQSTHINDPGRSIPYPYRQVAMKALLTPGICPMTGKPSADPPGK